MTADSKGHTCRYGHGRQRKKRAPRPVWVQLLLENDIQFNYINKEEIYFKLISSSVLRDIIQAIQRNYII